MLFCLKELGRLNERFKFISKATNINFLTKRTPDPLLIILKNGTYDIQFAWKDVKVCIEFACKLTRQMLNIKFEFSILHGLRMRYVHLIDTFFVFIIVIQAVFKFVLSSSLIIDILQKKWIIRVDWYFYLFTIIANILSFELIKKAFNCLSKHMKMIWLEHCNQ